MCAPSQNVLSSVDLQPHKGKEIFIRLVKQNGAWMLTVKDDGVGLPNDTKGSSGMGQRIMQSRARMIGGTLTVCNGEGGGVIVSCTTPVVD